MLILGDAILGLILALLNEWLRWLGDPSKRQYNIETNGKEEFSN